LQPTDADVVLDGDGHRAERTRQRFVASRIQLAHARDRARAVNLQKRVQRLVQLFRRAERALHHCARVQFASREARFDRFNVHY
jgi:hypothetical protein